MAIIGLDHVQLAMPPGAEDVAVEFYEGVLGITNVPKPPHLAVRGGCWFEDPPLRLHLGVEPDFRPARKAHPALVVDDLDALVERLGAAGHDVRVDVAPDGTAQHYVDDPFGNRLELVAPRA
jgi:catechol 2,3-dioxygenase-like lactoylglutathione lyase family enzyme